MVTNIFNARFGGVVVVVVVVDEENMKI